MCGVFGALSPDNPVLEEIYLGLYALQHRGQESAGAAWIGDDRRLHFLKGMGLVHEALKQDQLAAVPARAAIGHVRYSTSGGSLPANSQPLGANYARGPLAVAHNGNLTNTAQLAAWLEERGAIFQSSSDTETLLHLVAHQPGKPLLEALLGALEELWGAFSLAILTEDGLVAARDPWGFRPLSIGRRGRNHYVASETCAFQLLGAETVREVEPGELVLIEPSGRLTSFRLRPKADHPRLCAMELIYLARPDSEIGGRSVYEIRLELGRILARRAPALEADFVTGMPDSGTPAALGYAEEAGLPFAGAMVRNRYVGRTFIQPTRKVRELGVRIKLSPNRRLFNGRRAILVDDSLVRGTTARQVMRLIKEAGAARLHLGISSPPLRHPCFYGLDLPSARDLAAAAASVEEIRLQVGVDSLFYLNTDDLRRAFGPACPGFCTACFDGDYLPLAPGHIGRNF